MIVSLSCLLPSTTRHSSPLCQFLVGQGLLAAHFTRPRLPPARPSPLPPLPASRVPGPTGCSPPLSPPTRPPLLSPGLLAAHLCQPLLGRGLLGAHLGALLHVGQVPRVLRRDVAALPVGWDEASYLQQRYLWYLQPHTVHRAVRVPEPLESITSSIHLEHYIYNYMDKSVCLYLCVFCCHIGYK